MGIEFVVHMSTRHISFFIGLTPVDIKILNMKITVRYIEYIQMYLYQSADTIYCDIQYMMTTIIMFI